MTTVEGEIVYTRDRSSGRVHKRARIGKSLAPLEACNQDQAGEYDVLASLDDVDPADLCLRCFAAPEVQPVNGG